MRPLGDVAHAMLREAKAGGGTVRELAARACVGYAVARYTATRLVARGQLVRVSDDRPAVLAAPARAGCSDALQDALGYGVLPRSFWETGS